MKRKLRVALMVLLAAVTSVGSAWGDWKEYTGVNGVTWEYKEIESGATCSIRPENRSSISGRVEIPSTVEVGGVSIKVVSIGRDAFKGCSGLTAVTIPGSVTRIGDWSFFCCSGLTSVTIPDGVTAIGNGAFSSCSGLTAATIPNSVTRIGDWSFFGCTRLKAVTIPGSATEIGDGAFSGCSRLMLIEVENGSGNYHVDGGVLFMKDKAALGCYPAGKKAEKYTIPGNVTVIGSSAFEGCSKLTEVVIPSSVTRIERWAFSGCIGLTAVNIPSSVTEIGESAFSGCSGLMAVNIPSSVTEIRGQTFSGCSGLTAVSIPSSVTRIGESAFAGCSGLMLIEVENGSGNYHVDGGVLFMKDKAALGCYPAGKKAEKYTIPGNVTVIGSSAFEGCSKLTEVVIPSSVTRIERWAFSGCIGLTAVNIPSSVTEIGESAFSGCSGLMAVNIPSSVTEIRGQTFAGCSGLTAVSIPSSVTEIGWSSFEDCRDLTLVTIPSSVTEIGDGAFAGCCGLKSIEVESGNKNYCAESGVLFTKDKATLVCYPGGKPGESYTIPSSVTEIGRFAFSDCRGLTGVTIPSSVTEIGWGVFSDCRGLKAVYWLADANCRVKDEVFDGIASTATLYVRQGEKAATEETWWAKRYFSAVEEGYVVTLKDSDGNELGEQLVKPNNGTATAPTAPTKDGYTFVEWQLDGKKYDFSTKVTKNITLVAVWNKNEGSTPSTPKDPKDPEDPETAVESVQLAGVRVVRNPMGEALELEGMERAARVEVYSVAGARVHAEALRGEPRVAIDARGWASGVYVVRVVASDGEKTLRMVK